MNLERKLPEVVDRAGNWVLTDELCETCGSPSWDVYPAGVVRDRWTCPRCGHRHHPIPLHTRNETPLPDISEVAV